MELSGYNMENLTADHSCECIRRVSCTIHAEDPINIQCVSNYCRYERLNVSSLPNSVTVKFWCPVCPVPPSFLNSLDNIELVLVLSKLEQVAAER